MKLVCVLWVVAGCAAGPGPVDGDGDPIDGEDEAFDAGKIDGTGCPPSAASDDARGVLALANDPAATAEQLDAIGLSRRAASEIVDARPFADLAALDAVPYVGPYACRVLQREACSERGLCERVLPVWTWNIEHFPLTGGAVDAVAGVLGGDRAELVGFQEVDSLSAFEQLLGKLPGWEGLPGQLGFETQVAVAYRTDRLRVVATEDLFADDAYRFPRPPLAVTFEVTGRAGVRRVVLVVVHLKAMVDSSSRERRRQAIVTLEGWLAVRRATGDAVIVLGDWNDDIDAVGTQNVFAPLLAKPDAYAALTLEVAHRDGYSYIPYRRLIDHIVVTQEAVEQFPLQTIDPVKLDDTIPGYAETISDHRPVEARLVPIVPRS